jgi:hypothetical protein
MEGSRPRGSTLKSERLLVLSAGGKASEAARGSGVHVTTLRYRLERIPQVSDLGLDDPPIRLVAGRRERLRAALQQPRGVTGAARSGHGPRARSAETQLVVGGQGHVDAATAAVLVRPQVVVHWPGAGAGRRR